MKLQQTLIGMTLLLGMGSAQAEWAAGVGYPYGGAIGAQYSMKQGKDILFGSVGLVGVAIGYQRLLDPAQQHSLGVVAGTETFTSDHGFIAAQYNYYLSGANQPGWVIGLTAGQRQEDGKVGNHSLLGVHAGYRF